MDYPGRHATWNQLLRPQARHKIHKMGNSRGNKEREILKKNGVTNIQRKAAVLAGSLWCTWAAMSEKQHLCPVDAAEAMEK